MPNASPIPFRPVAWKPVVMQETICLIRDEYERADVPWILGFSGGKDSSALLRLAYAALVEARDHPVPVTVLYCDTGVEFPPIARLVRRTLKALATESLAAGLPISVRVARPRRTDSYFVRVIGRGYPPPTSKFRWCTD